ncbi:21.7 kDa class VI heat shock protein [Phalaenopsis equestris]|uniref:21.7 kDa class VI heat shock protein n=1 Tax=Phalaenopsis equestris TaxID=78828 RepID=UPI0009E5091D|nr:21.7 kDa class VI heat shock protein [Phalaenopsis equestris]
MSQKTALEIRTDDDENSQKWLLPLNEDVFISYLSQAGEIAQKVFGEGSLFSPLLFGKFFDPADAFPLWDFDSELLLSRFHRASKSSVDWSETHDQYILRAELPVEGRSVEVAICGDKKNLIEISGIWKVGNPTVRDWKLRKWWEYGFVRRLEVADDADCRKMEACINNDVTLEIIIPKRPSANRTLTQSLPPPADPHCFSLESLAVKDRPLPQRTAQAASMSQQLVTEQAKV